MQQRIQTARQYVMCNEAGSQYMSWNYKAFSLILFQNNPNVWFKNGNLWEHKSLNIDQWFAKPWIFPHALLNVSHHMTSSEEMWSISGEGTIRLVGWCVKMFHHGVCLLALCDAIKLQSTFFFIFLLLFHCRLNILGPKRPEWRRRRRREGLWRKGPEK